MSAGDDRRAEVTFPGRERSTDRFASTDTLSGSRPNERGVNDIMNAIAVLESQTHASVAHAKAEIASIHQRAADEGRTETAQERAQIDQLIREAESAKTQLARRQSVDALAEKIQALVPSGTVRGGAAAGGSLGAQVMRGELGAWLRDTRGARPQRWESPGVEVPYAALYGGALYAATLSEAARAAATSVIEPGVALIGAFQTAAQIFRKGGIRVAATNSHQDFFVKNLPAIRAELREALAVYRPAAFGEVRDFRKRHDSGKSDDDATAAHPPSRENRGGVPVPHRRRNAGAATRSAAHAAQSATHRDRRRPVGHVGTHR